MSDTFPEKLDLHSTVRIKSAGRRLNKTPTGAFAAQRAFSVLHKNNEDLLLPSTGNKRNHRHSLFTTGVADRKPSADYTTATAVTEVNLSRKLAHKRP